MTINIMSFFNFKEAFTIGKFIDKILSEILDIF